MVSRNKEGGMNKLDIEQIRGDIHDLDNKIFLNSAGSSLPSKSVSIAVKRHIDLEESQGGYKAGDLVRNEVANFHKNAAQLIGCDAKNIAYTNNATDSYLRALLSFEYKNGDVIITTDDDYASNYIHYISLKKRFGIEFLRIKNLENGDLNIESFTELVEKHNPKLVSVSHIPTNSGLIQDVKPIGEICHKRNIPFLLDACQSVGQLRLDVAELKCDFLSVTGRKFLRGPRGTGFLFVSDRLLESGIYPLTIDGGGAIWSEENDYKITPNAKRFEMWEKSYALQLGLSEAIRYANSIGMDNIEAYNKTLMAHFRNNLDTIKGVKSYDRGSRQGNILTFRKEGKSLEEMQRRLNEEKIYYSVSEKEWGFIDFGKKNVDWVVRLSPHYFNTIDEIDRTCEIIDSI